MSKQIKKNVNIQNIIIIAVKNDKIFFKNILNLTKLLHLQIIFAIIIVL